MKNKTFKLSLILVLFIIFSTNVLAQLPPVFDTAVDDTSSPAPISSLVALGLFVGAAIGYNKLRK